MRQNIYTNAEKQGKYDAKLQGSSEIAACIIVVTGAEAVTNLHLTAHLGHHDQSIGKPGKHTGYADTGHCAAAKTANPDHVDEIVGHLYKISHDNGHC